MNIIEPALITVGLAILSLWVVSLIKRDASIADVFWGLGYVALSFIALGANDPPTDRSKLLCLLVTIWGVRLAAHIGLRNHGQPEDYRYAAMRKQWGKHWWWASLGVVFGLQSSLMLLIATPLYSAATVQAAPLGLIDLIGCAAWVVGFIFEAGGDWQLKQFLAKPDNRGTTMQAGFWRYTRHPNYFGDALQWWGFFLIGGVATQTWWTIISPIVMTFLLMRVSGVPMLEERLVKTRPDFSDYAAKTNAFFPWPPKA